MIESRRLTSRRPSKHNHAKATFLTDKPGMPVHPGFVVVAKFKTPGRIRPGVRSAIAHVHYRTLFLAHNLHNGLGAHHSGRCNPPHISHGFSGVFPLIPWISSIEIPAIARSADRNAASHAAFLHGASVISAVTNHSGNAGRHIPKAFVHLRHPASVHKKQVRRPSRFRLQSHSRRMRKVVRNIL